VTANGKRSTGARRWNTCRELRRVRDTHGAAAIGAATPQATLEELYLLGKLAGGLGGGNVDFRLRQSDFSADDGQLRGAPWLGMEVAEISALDRILVIGSTLRKEQPLLAQRLRQAVKKGAQFNLINPVDDDLLCAANKACAPARS
jgi:NADH-quinone oxidoreductase subunit G